MGDVMIQGLSEGAVARIDADAAARGLSRQMTVLALDKDFDLIAQIHRSARRKPADVSVAVCRLSLTRRLTLDLAESLKNLQRLVQS